MQKVDWINFCPAIAADLHSCRSSGLGTIQIMATVGEQRESAVDSSDSVQRLRF